MTTRCSSCGHDPALEVECPVCRAGVGVECKRPSGHRVYGGEVHPERDRLAMQTVIGYDRCPAADRQDPTPPGWVQPVLFSEPGSETTEV